MSYPEMSLDVPWSLVKNGFHKAPDFTSLVQDTGAGRGWSSLSLKPYPTWAFEVDLNYVQGGLNVQYSILQKFVGLLMACKGRARPFYFTDPTDNSVDDQSLMLNVTPGAAAPMGQTGDGVSTQFQLARSIDCGVDILQQVSNVNCYVNGAPTVASVSALGVATFATAPANGAVLTWDGAFRYLCQFTEDSQRDLAMVSKDLQGFLWSCGSIAFESKFL